jgi:hypothetical protein
MTINRYEGKTFTKQSFVMDESFFINCVLSDCDLFYSGGDADWMNLTWENCRWHFRGPALKTMQLMQTVGMMTTPPPPTPCPANNLNVN